jgi:protein ImuA
VNKQGTYIADLRAHLHALQPRRHGVLAFGDARVDRCLAEGGLALGNLHAIAATGIETELGAVTAGFAASLLARLSGTKPVFWIAQNCDLYPAGLLEYGLDPARLVLVRAADDAETLQAMEATLRAGAAAAVLGEVGRLERTPARRLQLACLSRGSTGFVLRRWPWGQKGMPQDGHAANTSWLVTPVPSAAAHREPGPARWRVELLHARGGLEGSWIMEAGGTDAPHPLRVVAELADAATAPPGRHRAG